MFIKQEFQYVLMILQLNNVLQNSSFPNNTQVFIKIFGIDRPNSDKTISRLKKISECRCEKYILQNISRKFRQSLLNEVTKV